MLEFWAYGTIAGTYGGTIQNNAETQCYPFTYTLPAATWTKVRISIPGDKSGSWTLTGNVASCLVVFGLGVGATYSGPPGAWATTTAPGFFSANGALSVLAATGRQFAVTGVALMVGAAAANAEPEFRKYSDNLIDCQRYYQVIAASARFPASAASGNFECSLNWATMRAAPSATVAVAGTNANLLGGFPVLNSIQLYGSRFNIASAAAGDCYALAYSYALDADF
jgi:hypothetical protein